MNSPIPFSTFVSGQRSASEPTALSPTQAATLERLHETIRAVPVTVLTGWVGAGKTTLVKRSAEEFGGIRVSCRDVLQASEGANHLCYEEVLHRLIDGKTTDGPDIDTPQALTLLHEPKANVERYDGLRVRIVGGRHAS